MEYLCCGAVFLVFVGALIAVGQKANEAAKAKSKAKSRSRRASARSVQVSEDNLDLLSDYGLSIEVSYGGLTNLSGKPSTSESCWIPPGTEARVGKRRIPGGMIYVGSNLPAVRSQRQVEPAMIDPNLERRDNRPDTAGEGMGYWPSYASIPPASRSGYLAWLEGGRSGPDAYIGYVFLYFYGLERRALADAKTISAARNELPLIQAEVERLLRIYAGNGSFRGYATRFGDTLAYLLSQFDGSLAPLGYRSGPEVPLDIRVAVGSAALAGTSLPAGLALAWATSDPMISLRTPARRCRDEFRELFLIRYEARHSTGLRLPTCKRTVRVEYRPASASFSESYSARTEIPNVTALIGPRRKLTDLVEEVTTDLESYSRKLGRDPSSADPLAAAASLPAELLASHAPPEVRTLIQGLEAKLEQGEAQVLPAAEPLGFWLPKDGSKQSKKDAIAAVSMLAHSGIGIEPDVRFGGPKLSAKDQVAVFRVAQGDPEAPSSAYAAASLLLHLAAMVAAADGEVSMDEERQLQHHVTRTLHLEAGEQRRLAAHVAWLLANPPGLAGVKKRVEALSAQQRHSIGRFLVQVAAADGHIDPSEVTTLTKLFGVLGLDPGEVHGELHAIQAQSPSPDAPVSVRPARPTAPGKAIPHPQTPEPKEAAPSELDMSLVEAKLQESTSVSALLSSIFVEEEETVPQPSDHTEAVEDGPLDAAHMALLRDLTRQRTWEREDYEALADSHGLMPDGALDVLNELAWDTCDQALAEDDDPLEINMEVCGELLGS